MNKALLDLTINEINLIIWAKDSNWAGLFNRLVEPFPDLSIKDFNYLKLIRSGILGYQDIKYCAPKLHTVLTKI